MSQRTELAAGVALAAVAALAFGLTIPVLAWAGAGLGPFTTAALLYAGAFLLGGVLHAATNEAGAPLTRRDAAPLAIMALSGAAIAPTLLAWGLQRTDPMSGALLLNLEVAWTVLLAWRLFGESLARRGVLAVVLMVAGGVVLATRVGVTGDSTHGGVLAIAGAMFAWAIDNAASRRVAEARPSTVVALKGVLGAALTGSLALVSREPSPAAWQTVALLAAGASGYGASLRFYLLAQRKLGAARTASVFSIAPFIGATVGLFLAPSSASWALGGASVCFALGLWFHSTEKHGHRHQHPELEHEHTHRHDDGHHDHAHTPSFEGEHSHPHRHDVLEHTHEHGADIHHGHSH